jgi:enamine deaminase RidA (YjgF/YER057c/UK114 family)
MSMKDAGELPQTRVRTLSPSGAITPTATWSVGARAGDFVFVAGMRGIDPKTNALVEGEEARVRQAFLNMKLIAESEGASLRDAVRLVVYVTDMGTPAPARQQSADRAVGRRALSAADDRGSARARAGRHRRGRGDFLRTGEPDHLRPARFR